MFFKNKKIIIYIILFISIFFLNYSFYKIFDEDLIIISCFIFIFFNIKNKITKIILKDIDLKILIIKNQIINIFNLKKKIFFDILYNYNILIFFIFKNVLNIFNLFFQFFYFFFFRNLNYYIKFCRNCLTKCYLDNLKLEKIYVKNKVINLFSLIKK